MPLTAKGEKILSEMTAEYGAEKGKEVFYASKNAGKITGVDSADPAESAKGDEAMPIPRAAGILIISAKGNALFLHRTAAAPDCPGCWDFPGGGREGDESAQQTAERETREEIGQLPEGKMALHTRTMSCPPTIGVAGGVASPVLPVQAEATAVPAPAPTVIMPTVDFTTFILRTDEEFTPELDGEHDGFAWAPPNSPPQMLHPGCQIAIDRLTMDELGVARAIADGRLASPQIYENVHLWAIRITGTGIAFRPKDGEFVLRKPEEHLTADALARYNGLPVIMKHPKAALLNSEEFSNRIVGTIFLPYVAGDEAWGIAKIYDDDANREMEGLSTSPGVNFKDFSVNAKLTLEDGSKVLVEGKPSLVDHVAVCELGVWDKGSEPTGIRSEAKGDSAMTDKTEAKKDETAKGDADAGTQPDNKLSHAIADAMKPFTDAVGKMADAIGGMTKRFDAFEKKEEPKDDAAKDDSKKDEKEEGDKGEKDDARKDAKKDDEDGKDKDEDEPKKTVADKKDAKKDASEDGDKDKKDAKSDAKTDDVGHLRTRLEEVAAMMPKSLGDADFYALTDAQAKADDVFAKFGQHAPRPLAGETVGAYERRITKQLKVHSPTWKAADVQTAFADDASFGIVRDQVYKEAAITATNPANIPDGELRMTTKKQGGHEVREFYGSPRSWMDPMAGQVKLKATGGWNTGSIRSGAQ